MSYLGIYRYATKLEVVHRSTTQHRRRSAMKKNHVSESNIEVAVVESSVLVVCDRSGGSNVVENGQKEARRKRGRRECLQKEEIVGASKKQAAGSGRKRL